MSYKTIFNDIKVFVLDVDGVLTNGQMIIMPDGSLVRSMNVKDGYAIKYAIEQGYHFAIISGGKNEMVQDRLEKLGIDFVFIDITDKKAKFLEFCETNNFDPKNVLYMGDDMPDYPLIKMAGMGCCPADAVREILDVADYVSHVKGGEGCVRDVIEQTLRVQGKWTIDLHIKAPIS